MKKLFSILIILLLAFSATSFAQDTDSSEGHDSDSTMSDSMNQNADMNDDDSMEHSDGMMDSDDSMKDSDAMMMEENRPEWHSLELTNAVTGEAFTLASLSGKTVFVEPMATWCPNCSRQLSAVNSARAQFASEEMGEDFVFLALSIEGNLANERLASHAERLGLSENIVFAVATQDLIRGISENYGRSALNPPSTPHFIIKSNGDMTEVKTGMESSQEIYDELAAAHASTMMMEQSN